MTTPETRRFLLDTHTFLWLADDEGRVPESLREHLQHAEHEVWLSLASVWEMAIKKSLGKLRLQVPLHRLLESQCQTMAVRLLDIRTQHVLTVESLPFHHRDPFDRLLVAQALVEGLEVASSDRAFDLYPVSRAW